MAVRVSSYHGLNHYNRANYPSRCHSGGSKHLIQDVRPDLTMSVTENTFIMLKISTISAYGCMSGGG